MACFGTWKHSTVTVPAGAVALNVSLAEGSGDGNLYVHTSQPTTSVYTCRSNGGTVTNGNAEYGSVPSPAAGTRYVSVYGAGSVSNTTLCVTTYQASGDVGRWAVQALGLLENAGSVDTTA